MHAKHCFIIILLLPWLNSSPCLGAIPERAYSWLAYEAVSQFTPLPTNANIAWGLEQEQWRVGLGATNLVFRVGQPVWLQTFIHNLDTSRPEIRRATDASLHSLQFVVLNSRRQQLHSTNEFLSHKRIHGKFRDDDPINNEFNRISSWAVKPNGAVVLTTDLSRLFDLSMPGEYLVNVRRPQSYEDRNRSPWRFELVSGNLLIRVLAADSPLPPPDAKQTGQTNAESLAPKKSSPQTLPAEGAGNTGSVTGKERVVSNSGVATQTTGKNKVETVSPKSANTNGGDNPTRVSLLSRTSLLAFLFALLGLGVLWWLFRGK